MSVTSYGVEQGFDSVCPNINTLVAKQLPVLGLSSIINMVELSLKASCNLLSTVWMSILISYIV